MKKLKTQIELFEKEFSQQLATATDKEKLENVRISFLGRKGKIAALMAQMKVLPVDEKRLLGPLLNELKKTSEQLLHEKKENLISIEQTQEKLKQQQFDVSAYKPDQQESSIHIYTQVIERIQDIFISMGYEVADGPEVETDYYNFQALNIPADHPARDMHDTFWLNIPDMLMRTHTSPVQIREMENKGAPRALIAPGRVYRHEATDASHDFMFSQVEGLLIDKNVSISHLLATAKTFLQEFFEEKNLNIRVRPGYFPFVEPGVEIDASCPFCKAGCSVCKRTGWIEIMGGGLMHPTVLAYGGIDTNVYSAFAFGFGIERVAMIKHGINDIRLFHSGAVNFLKQF